MEIVFTNPTYLILLFLVPLVVIVYFVSLKSKKKYALNFANFDAIARIKGIDLYSKNISGLVITILIIALLTFSISGLTISRNVNTSASAFVLAIDVSKSMEADDFTPNRLESAKSSAENFVDALPLGTKVGVVSFSGNSKIEIFPTDDSFLVKRSLEDIPISSIGGTDIYEAIITSVNLLEGQDGKALVILSDGQLNVGDFQGSLSYAIEKNVVVHTVAIGTPEGGNTSFGVSRLDESSLRSVAFETGGSYFRVVDDEDLVRSLSEIVSLRVSKVPLDLSQESAIGAILLIFVYFILVNTKLRVFP